jgi:hypothetical protein
LRREGIAIGTYHGHPEGFMILKLSFKSTPYFLRKLRSEFKTPGYSCLVVVILEGSSERN